MGESESKLEIEATGDTDLKSMGGKGKGGEEAGEEAGEEDGAVPLALHADDIVLKREYQIKLDAALEAMRAEYEAKLEAERQAHHLSKMDSVAQVLAVLVWHM
jgi:hypothetical protein